MSSDQTELLVAPPRFPLPAPDCVRRACGLRRRNPYPGLGRRWSGPGGKNTGVDAADREAPGPPFPGERFGAVGLTPPVSEVSSVKCRVGGHLSQWLWGLNRNPQGVL